MGFKITSYSHIATEMEGEQMMELMKAIKEMMDANQANQVKTDDDREERKANQTNTDYDRGKMLAKTKAMREKMTAAHEGMLVMLDVRHERMMTWFGKTEATDLEANSEENESVAEHQGVPKEHAALETGRGAGI
jgi:hypothetical protein